MSEEFKLGLTRNRLFSFDNCVGFLGGIEDEFDFERCEKALNILSLKEPVLCCGIELRNNGEAFLVKEKNQLSLKSFQGDVTAFLKDMKLTGMDFSETLFSFVILNNNTLCVFAHTVIADVRSLMYLAAEFMHIYENNTRSVVPSEIMVLSETSQIPLNAHSVVIGKLASNLEVGWQKKTKVFDVNDYKIAHEKYLNVKNQRDYIDFEISEDVFDKLRTFAKRESVDVSSIVAYAFYKSLANALSGKRKYRKLNVQANERVFFEDGRKMHVGALNGVVTVSEKKGRGKADTLESGVAEFHKEIYKRVTSAFTTLYNEFLYMQLSPSFTDSQYMYCVGEFQHKYSKKLAEVYGCANEVMGEFCSYNLNQEMWRGLDVFDDVVLFEPFKMRSTTMLTFVEKGSSAKLHFDYKKEKISYKIAQNIVENMVEMLESIG